MKSNKGEKGEKNLSKIGGIRSILFKKSEKGIENKVSTKNINNIKITEGLKKIKIYEILKNVKIKDILKEIKNIKISDIIKNAKTIKSKLMLILFIVITLLLSLTGTIITTTVNNSFTNNEKEILYETSESISNEAELFFERYVTIVKQMTNDKNIQDFLVRADENDDIWSLEDFDVIRNTLKETKKMENDIILSAYIAEDNPSYYINNLSGLSDSTYDIKNEEYYVTITEGIINISEPYIDAGTGYMVISITAPVYANNKIVGLTGINISIDALTKVVGEYKLGETGYFSLLSKNNIIASHKDAANISKPINDIGISKDLLNSINEQKDVIVDYKYNKNSYLGNSVLIGDTGWKVVSAMPKDEFTKDTKALVGIIIIIYVLAILILSTIMYVVIGVITKPIKKITEITNKLADGELDVEMDIKSNDEIGELAKSIDSLTKRLKSYIVYINESVNVLDEFAKGNLVMDLHNDYDGEFVKLKDALINVSDILKDTIGKIKFSSESINANAEQVSSGAQILAQGTTEQASAIEELSAEINEIYQAIVTNAKNAENAGRTAIEALKEVDKGNAQMNEMLQAMEEIRNSSNKISKIIKVIDDIAFQTNILALNAAIEAARAGTFGKGFAVVADEVKNLAGKSSEAAKQTTAFIENSIIAINKGASLADKTGISLGSIVSKTKITSDLITEIVDASSKQSVSVNQIKSGIEQISSVVQQNAQTAETSAANSEELSGQSQILNDLVSHFNVDALDIAYTEN